MSAPRVFMEDVALPAGATVPLSREEARHVRSRRLPDGTAVIVLDGKGARRPAVLASGGTAVLLSTFEESPGAPGVRGAPGEPALRVTVLLAAAEPARIEWAIEKGTECGAAAFVLVAAERSQKAQVAALAARLGRLGRIAVEAAKQCDRTFVPAVEGPLPLAGAISRGPRPLLVLDPGAPHLSARMLGSGAAEAAVAIGPEGGFSAREMGSFREAGALRAGLGPRILRLETAVVAALVRLVEHA